MQITALSGPPASEVGSAITRISGLAWIHPKTAKDRILHDLMHVRPGGTITWRRGAGRKRVKKGNGRNSCALHSIDGFPSMTGDQEDSGRSVQSGAGQAAKQILDEIISGDLRAGYRLYMRDLVMRTDLGPTPLREGMSRLIASGLVKAIDQRGFQVAEIERSDIEDFTEFRFLLEENALRHSLQNGDSAWLDGVERARAAFAAFSWDGRERPRDSIMRYSGLHKALHASFISACGSLRLRNHLDLLYDQEIFYCHNLISKSARLDDLMKLHDVKSHVELTEAVLGQDADAACKVLATHLRQMLAALRSRLAAYGTSAPDDLKE